LRETTNLREELVRFYKFKHLKHLNQVRERKLLVREGRKVKKEGENLRNFHLVSHWSLYSCLVSNSTLDLSSDMIKRLMSYPKCRSVEVINNPIKSKSNHMDVIKQ